MNESKQLLLETIAGSIQSTIKRRPVSLIGGGAWTLKQGNTSFQEMASILVRDPAILSDIIIGLAKDLGEGIVYIGAGYNNVLPALVRGVELVYKADFSPYLPEVSPEQNEEFIKKCHTFDVTKIWDDPLINSFLRVGERVSGSLKESHVITPLTWGPFTLVGQLIGTETLMRKIMKDPAAVYAVFDLAVNVIWEFCRPFLEKQLVDIIYLAEPTASGDMISARIFEKFVVPLIDKCLKPYHEQGIPTLVHICGTLTGNHLDNIDAITNLDAISLDSKVDLKYARERIKRKCIGGNLDTLNLERSTEQEVINELKQILINMEGHVRFIVMPACDLAPSTPYSNVKAFFEYVQSYRMQ